MRVESQDWLSFYDELPAAITQELNEYSLEDLMEEAPMEVKDFVFDENEPELPEDQVKSVLIDGLVEFIMLDPAQKEDWAKRLYERSKAQRLVEG